MSGRSGLHRPLQSGIQITSRTGAASGTGFVGGGTLGCLATRSNGDKVLVTNLHVMVGTGRGENLTEPTGNEKMFQGGDSYAHKVGDIVDWEEVKIGRDNPMEVDAAICTLDDDIDPWGLDPDDLGATFRLHDEPHGNRSIIVGTKEPTSSLDVILLGGVTGEITGHVFGELENEFLFLGSFFNGLFWVSLDADTMPGNSGSPILHKVEDGVYELVGFHMGHLGDRRMGLACRASAVTRQLNVTFGHNKPIVNAGYTQQAHVGDLVTLDGSGSDPDNRGDVTFRWKQVFSPPSLVLSEDPVDLSDETDPSPTFTPVKVGNLEFELTVTDVDGLSASDAVTINVVPPPAPVANAGENRQEDTGVPVTLNGSTSTPMEGLTYSWVVEEPTHGVTLVDANTARPYFTSPVEDVDVAFTLTVTDGLGRTATASVTLRFRDTWSDWQDVVPIQHQGELAAGAR